MWLGVLMLHNCLGRLLLRRYDPGGDPGVYLLFLYVDRKRIRQQRQVLKYRVSKKVQGIGESGYKDHRIRNKVKRVGLG